MKPNRDALALAASLTSAANTPLPLPKERVAEETAVFAASEAKRDTQAAKTAAKARRGVEKAQITLRPDRGLLDDYTFEAAERTKITRRVVSAQEIMLEVLERGRPGSAQ
jgi:hypothetical protein